MTAMAEDYFPRSVGPNPGPWEPNARRHDPDELHRTLDDVIRARLDDMTTRLMGQRLSDQQSDALAMAQWLGPFLQQTILEAVRLGYTLRAEGTAEKMGDAPQERGAQAVAASAPVQGADAAPPVTAGGRWDHPGEAGSAPDPVEPAAGTGDSSGGIAPWLVGGHLTLLASPFEGFADVQKFLDQLGQVERLNDVKPKRFTGGRLYVTLNSAYPDIAALTDALETELARYRPEVRSTQNDLIELLLKPAVD